jgi:signal transduction histidine kinase
VRGPLSAMKLATHVLGRSATDAVQVRAIGTLERQIEQIARLTGDLMDASQIQAGKVQLQRVRVRAAAVLTQAIEAVRSTTDARAQEVAVEGAGDLWFDVDPARTVQILSNLLHNASKFSPEGSRIVVRLALQDPLVCIRVSDAGVGIPADKLEWVFDSYAQMKPGGSGLGLGLSLVRRLVELHGGRIQAFSDGPGQGTTFAAWLPAAGAESPQPAALASAEASAAGV